MAINQTYVDYSPLTPIRADWLNNVNTIANVSFPALQTTVAGILANPTFTGPATFTGLITADAGIKLIGTGANPNKTIQATGGFFEIANNAGSGAILLLDDSGNLNVSGTISTSGGGQVAPLASPAFAGTPSAPTATAYTNNTNLANTAFVQTAIENVIVNVKNFGATGNGSSDDTAAINAADAFVAAQGGGTVYFPPGTYATVSGLTKNTSNVKWKGAGGSSWPNGTLTAATTILYTGLSGGIVINCATPSTTSTIKFVDITDMAINGNNLAARGLQIVSVKSSLFQNLFVYGCTAYCYLLDTVITQGGGEPMDVQQCYFINCNWQALIGASSNAIGMYLTSYAGDNVLGGGNSNPSFNTFVMCGGQNNTNPGIVLGDCDNNTFISCRVFRVGSSVPGLDIWGGDNNYFFGFSCGGSLGIRIQGIGAGYWNTPVKNAFYANDTGNGTLFPTCLNGTAVNGAPFEYYVLTTSATAGAASALPGPPAGYYEFTLPTGALAKFPYYNV